MSSFRHCAPERWDAGDFSRIFAAAFAQNREESAFLCAKIRPEEIPCACSPSPLPRRTILRSSGGRFTNGYISYTMHYSIRGQGIQARGRYVCVSICRPPVSARKKRPLPACGRSGLSCESAATQSERKGKPRQTQCSCRRFMWISIGRTGTQAVPRPTATPWRPSPHRQRGRTAAG